MHNLPLIRRLGSSLVGLLLALGSTAHAAAPTPVSSVRAMYVGHSLINNEIPAIVQAMAVSKGRVSRSAVQWFVGAPLQYNWDNCRASAFTGQWAPPIFACDEIDRRTDVGPYDVLVAAQANNPIINTTLPDDLGSTPQYLEEFVNFFLDRAPDGRPFLYAVWEGQGSPWHQGQEWTTRIAAELARWEHVANLVEGMHQTKRGRSVDINIIPANLALRDLILAAESGNFAGVTNRSQLFVDDVHLSGLGYYYVACVVYASLFQESPAGAVNQVRGAWSDVANVEPELASRLQTFAWNVVANYRGWTTASVSRPKAPSSLIVR